MVKNSSKLYNHEQKVRFLENEYPNEGTQNSYATLLKATAKFENEKEKDLCDFSYSDAVETLIGLKKKTFKSLDVAQTIIVKYIDWSIAEGYSKTGINSFKLITKENLKKYTHQIAQKKSYITREEMYEICNQLYNPIDRVFLPLLFEGVRGRTENENSFEELRNLKYTDLIPSQNIVKATRNNGESRIVRVDERTMHILVESMSQEEYHKNNGEAQGKFAVMPLKDSGYVARGLDRKSNALDDRIAVSNINTKFKNFREYLGIQFLNPTLVFQSGMIEKCASLEKEKDSSLQAEDYRQIYRNYKLDDRAWANLKEIFEDYKKNLDLKNK